MEHSISDALSIMIVGMVTVFIILWLVVLIGNLLIRITNKYWPEAEVSKKVAVVSTSSQGTIAAIVAAVDSVTNGKGKVTNITKV
jgi:oxaloacetate decarboxylase gamma subunit